MPDEFRTKFDPTRRFGDSTPQTASQEVPAEDAEPDAEAGTQSYSLISADRRQKIMLELRFKTGNATALAYSYLVSVNYDPSLAIRMDFSGYEVILMGRNLGPLFAALVAHRVAVVLEIDDLEGEATLPAGATIVTQIQVKALRNQP